MTTSSSETPRRLILLAGVAAAVWVVFQLGSLVVSDSPNAWAWQGLAINVLPTLLLAVAVLRGSERAAIVLGIYGLLRFLMAARVMLLLARGAASQMHDGLGLETGLVMIFSALWIAGGLGAYLALRALHASTSSGSLRAR